MACNRDIFTFTFVVVKCEVLTAVVLESTSFWNVRPYNLGEAYHRSSEAQSNTQHTARRYIPTLQCNPLFQYCQYESPLLNSIFSNFQS
jgi:hypothetical protein